MSKLLHIQRASDGSYSVARTLRVPHVRSIPTTQVRSTAAPLWRDALPHGLHSVGAGCTRAEGGGLQRCSVSPTLVEYPHRPATSLLLRTATIPKEYYKVFCPHDRAYFVRCARCERTALEAAANLRSMLREEWGWLGAQPRAAVLRGSATASL